LCAEGIRRRYSDFEWLRDLLVARYHGIAVPLMPEKRVVGNQVRRRFRDFPFVASL
jgi:hypothetical protein